MAVTLPNDLRISCGRSCQPAHRRTFHGALTARSRRAHGALTARSRRAVAAWSLAPFRPVGWMRGLGSRCMIRLRSEHFGFPQLIQSVSTSHREANQVGLPILEWFSRLLLQGIRRHFPVPDAGLNAIAQAVRARDGPHQLPRDEVRVLTWQGWYGILARDPWQSLVDCERWTGAAELPADAWRQPLSSFDISIAEQPTRNKAGSVPHEARELSRATSSRR